MSKHITVKLSPEELHRICGDLASELHNDSILECAEDDYAGTVKEWRQHSPRYVAKEAANAERAHVLYKGLGGKDSSDFDRETAEATREMHDKTADLLDRLLKQLPLMEVTA